MGLAEETGERRCSACVRQWIWWTSLVQVCGNAQEIVSGERNQGCTTHVRYMGGVDGWSEHESSGCLRGSLGG